MCHRLGGFLSNRNFSLPVLQVESLRSQCQHGQVKAFFWVRLLTVSSDGGKRRAYSGIPSRRAFIPFMRVPPSRPKHLPKAPPPN